MTTTHKPKRLIITAALLLAYISSIFVAVIPVVHVNAQASLSVAERRACRTAYNGHGSGAGTDREFTAAKQRQYEADKCDKSQGGNCEIKDNVVACERATATTDPATDPTTPNPDTCGIECTSIGSDRDLTDCAGGLDGGNCEVMNIIVTITNALSAMAAIVIVAMIIVGGIQYSSAGVDASKIQAAKSKITNALIALLLLIFGFSLVQWLVPGGLL